MKTSFNFWQKWLVVINIIFIIFGFLVAFAGDSLLFEMHNTQTKAIFFHGQELSTEAQQLKQFLFGIIGGTMAGFHLMMVYIALYPFKKKEKWAYNSLLYGLLIWFFIDSGLSIYHGAIHNVYLVNIVALLGIGIPLLFTWKDFR